MTELTPLEELEQTLKLPMAVIYKHSSRCALSRSARTEMGKFEQEIPDLPVFIVDVVRHPAVSTAIEERTGIKHESPQAILLRDGAVTWHASHYDVTRASLRDNLAA